MQDVLLGKLNKAIERYAESRIKQGKMIPAYLTKESEILWTLKGSNGSNYQSIPKKLHARMQKIAKQHMIETLTHPEGWVRNLLKSFEWKFVPSLKPTQEQVDEAREKRLIYLQSLHTKQLIQELRRTYGGWSEHFEDEIKSVLATRPHVPKKQDRAKKVKENRGTDRKPAPKPRRRA